MKIYAFGNPGSSDFDQEPKWIAKLKTKLAISMVYPIVRDGAAKSKMFRKRMDSQYVRVPRRQTGFDAAGRSAVKLMLKTWVLRQ